MVDQERLAKLEGIAKNITGLPVADQFRKLGEAGLKLQEINWKNCVSDPGAELNIPTTEDQLRVG